MIKSFLQNLTLITISCLLTLIAAELGLRIVGYKAGNPFERLINHNDAYTGYRMIPGTHEVIGGPDGVYDVKIISLGLSEDRGFRDDGTEDQANSLFFGDSFVWGYGVNLEDSVSEQYQRLSSKPAINLGMTAYTSPTQYARLFSKYGPELSAQYAFFGFFIGNDFGDSTNFDDWSRSDKLVSYPEWKTRKTRGMTNDDWNTRIRLYAYSRSALWRLISDRVNFNLGSKKPTNDIVEVKQANLDLVLVPNQIQSSLGPDGDRQIELIRRALYDIRRTGDRTQTLPIIFVIPTKELVYQDRLPIGPIRSRVDERYVLALKLLEESGLDYVDLLPVFRVKARQEAEEQLYFRVDGHWTSAGHELASITLHDYVQSVISPDNN